MLGLGENKIGAAGAASIGDALAYVQSGQPTCSVYESIPVVCNVGTTGFLFGIGNCSGPYRSV